MADDELLSAVSGILEGVKSIYIPRKQAEYEDFLTRQRLSDQKRAEIELYELKKPIEFNEYLTKQKIENANALNLYKQKSIIDEQKLPIQEASQMRINAAKEAEQAKYRNNLSIEEKYKEREKVKLFGKKPEADTRFIEAKSALDEMKQAATDLLNHKGLKWGTGFTSPIGMIKGTSVSDFQLALESLKAQVGFNALQKMRDNSKTGGALGNVSDTETRLLQSSIASLDEAQSDEQMIKSLKKIIENVENSKYRMDNAYLETYGINAPSIPMLPKFNEQRISSNINDIALQGDKAKRLKELRIKKSQGLLK